MKELESGPTIRIQMREGAGEESNVLGHRAPRKAPSRRHNTGLLICLDPLDRGSLVKHLREGGSDSGLQETSPKKRIWARARRGSQEREVAAKIPVSIICWLLETQTKESWQDKRKWRNNARAGGDTIERVALELMIRSLLKFFALFDLGLDFSVSKVAST